MYSNIIISRILAGTPETRKILLKSIENLHFTGDCEIIIKAINILPTNFSYLDLYKLFPTGDSKRLIAFCMQLDNEATKRKN